jgi:hypothetical protein
MAQRARGREMSNIYDTVKALRATADQLEQLFQGKPRPTLKNELLKHYADGEPALFAQFDAFTNCHKFDEFMPPDKDGHCLMSTQAHELRRSAHSVRVQIRSGTDAKTAVTLLQKILDDVKSTAKHGGAGAFTFAPVSEFASFTDDGEDIAF